MDEQQIRQIVRDEANRIGDQSTYNTLQIPRHVHNGVDSPLLVPAYLTYVGLIQGVGVPTILPSGWTVVHLGTGQYEIVHNLGANTAWMVVAMTYDLGTPAVIQYQSPITTPNSVLFEIYDLAGSALDNDFAFELTVVNNTKYPPTYFGTIF